MIGDNVKIEFIREGKPCESCLNEVEKEVYSRIDAVRDYLNSRQGPEEWNNLLSTFSGASFLEEEELEMVGNMSPGESSEKAKRLLGQLYDGSLLAATYVDVPHSELIAVAVLEDPGGLIGTIRDGYWLLELIDFLDLANEAGFIRKMTPVKEVVGINLEDVANLVTEMDGWDVKQDGYCLLFDEEDSTLAHGCAVFKYEKGGAKVHVLVRLEKTDEG